MSESTELTLDAQAGPPAQSTEPPSEAQALFALITGPQANEIEIARLQMMQQMYLDALMREREVKFQDALVKVQKKLPSVVRTKHNGQTSSKYAPLDQIVDVCAPHITKAGFSTTFQPYESKKEGWQGMHLHVSHSGFTRTYDLEMPYDTTGPKGHQNKTEPHGIMSSIMYLRRGLYCAAFNITTKDDRFDDDGNAAGRHDTISREQAQKIEDMIIANTAEGEDRAKVRADVLRIYKIEWFEDLPANRHDALWRDLAAWKSKRDKNKTHPKADNLQQNGDQARPDGDNSTLV